MTALKYDLKGQRFGRLRAVRYLGMVKGQGRNYWECECDCGTITLADSVSLRTGMAKSCGCRKRKYHAGDVIGEITLLRFDTGSRRNWVGVCSCGTEVIITPSRLYDSRSSAVCRACSAKKYKRKDITGQRFGRLVALECVGTDKHRNSVWNFRCDCGHEVVRRINEIQKPRKRGEHSCGVCASRYASASTRSHEHIVTKE